MIHKKSQFINETKQKTRKMKTKKCFLHFIYGKNYHFDSVNNLTFTE